MNCILSKLGVKNYKSIDEVEVDFNSQLSVFIGKNGSGKSVFLSSLLLLQQVLRQRELGRRIRKRKDELSEDRIPTELEASFIFEDETVVTYKVFVDTESIDSESSRMPLEIISDYWYVKIKGKRKTGKIIMPMHFNINDLEEDEELYLPRAFTRKRYSKSKIMERMIDQIIEHQDYFKAISSFSRKIKYYSATQFADPSKCPSSFEYESSRNRVRPYRTAHKQFMSDLYNLSIENPDLYEVFKDIVCNRRLELINDIEFSIHELPSYDVNIRSGGKVVKKETSRQVVVPFFTKDSYKLSPSHLSEGTFKTLALLFYIISDYSSMILIEEPEVCVHHGLLSNILHVIKSNSYEKQVLLTTHSESVLDLVQPENLFAVLWRSHTEIMRFDELLGKNGLESLRRYLKSTGNLGEYIRHRDLLDE